MSSIRTALSVLLVGLLWTSVPAIAQSLGTLRWQQQPYCNVFTVTVEQNGGIYTLDGFDDQCGVEVRAAVGGLAFLNPDGSIGMGLTVITAPGATPVYLDVRVSPSTVSGTWRDSSGQSGVWAFSPGPLPGGSPRPLQRTVFGGGLSAGGVAITNVGPPSAPTDAATKSIVDNGDAAARAYAHALATASVPVTAYAATVTNGSATPISSGCVSINTSSTSLVVDLAIPEGASIMGVVVRYNVGTSNAAGLKFHVHSLDWPDVGAVTDTPILSFDSSLGGTGIYRSIRNELRTVSGPPVTRTRSYYLAVNGSNTHGPVHFCGAQALYSMP